MYSFQLLQNVCAILFGLLVIGSSLFYIGRHPHRPHFLRKSGAICGYLLVCFRTLRIHKELWPDTSGHPFAIGAIVTCFAAAIICYRLGKRHHLNARIRG